MSVYKWCHSETLPALRAASWMPHLSFCLSLFEMASLAYVNELVVSGVCFCFLLFISTKIYKIQSYPHVKMCYRSVSVLDAQDNVLTAPLWICFFFAWEVKDLTSRVGGSSRDCWLPTVPHGEFLWRGCHLSSCSMIIPKSSVFQTVDYKTILVGCESTQLVSDSCLPQQVWMLVLGHQAALQTSNLTGGGSTSVTRLQGSKIQLFASV